MDTTTDILTARGGPDQQIAIKNLLKASTRLYFVSTQTDRSVHLTLCNNNQERSGPRDINKRFSLDQFNHASIKSTLTDVVAYVVIEYDVQRAGWNCIIT